MPRVIVKITFPDGDTVDAELVDVQMYDFSGLPMVDAKVRFAYTVNLENLGLTEPRNLEQKLEDKAEYLGE